MDKYKIPCTPEQTKKALELGAPIEVKSIENAPKEWHGKACFTGMATCAKIPTTEEMLGWLRENDLYVNIIHISAGYTSWIKTIKKNLYLSKGNTGYVNSFEEATFAGINAALEYLTNNKK